MWRLLIVPFILTTLTNGEDTQWEKEMQAGKLPEMTLNQQMQLFGAKIAVAAPSPMPEEIESSTTEAAEPFTPAPQHPHLWESGSLPPMTTQQKIVLFGSTAVEEGRAPIDPLGEIGSSYEDGAYSHYFQRTQRSLSASLSNLVSTGNLFENFPSPAREQSIEGRGRMQKILIPILLALTIIAAILLPALMTVIKLIAVKGLWSGVVSLIISKLLGLKALLSHHHHSDHPVQNSRPYFVYLNHGKHRREEEGQDFRLPQDAHYQHEDWDQWRREGANTQA